MRGLLVTALLFALFVLGLLITPAPAQTVGGIDCAVIRKLTALERWYWIKRLGLAPAQIVTIKRTCGIK